MMSHELLKDLRLRILGNWEILGNFLNYIKWVSPAPSPLAITKVLLILEENSWKIEIKLFPLCAIWHEI